MLKRMCLQRCIATTSVALCEDVKNHSYQLRYDQLCSNPESSLSSTEYKQLLVHWEAYRGLQLEYGVKQSEMERTRRVANYCGLEFPKKRETGGGEGGKKSE